MSDDSPAFVDTNVLVYAFDASDSRQPIAEQLLSELTDTNRLRLSTQVLQELYVTVTRKIETPLAPQEALDVLDDLAAWPVVQLDYRLIREAILLSGNAQLSLWDSLIVVAAKQSGAPILYTEDLNHGQKILEVEVVNPFRAGP